MNTRGFCVVIVSLLNTCLVPINLIECKHSTVTNEDIRDAILQVVNVVRVTEDKLERHEYRERVFSEQVKKGIMAIDKRIRTLDSFKGLMSRLDERLAAVETVLMQRETKEIDLLKKAYEKIEEIENNLPKIVLQLKKEIIGKVDETVNKLIEQQAREFNKTRLAIPEPTPLPPTPPPTLTKKELEELFKTLSGKLESITTEIDKVKSELNKVEDGVKRVHKAENRTAENLDKVKHQLNTSEHFLEKYENQLAEYFNKVPDVSEHNECLDVLKAFNEHKSKSEHILSEVKSTQNKLHLLVDRKDAELIANSTLAAINELREQTTGFWVKSRLGDKVELEAHKTRFSVLEEKLNVLTDHFENGTKEVLNEIASLGRVEQVMVQTADSVLDTKRRIEYGVQHIVSEVLEAIKVSSKDVDAAISERFDTFELSILNEDTGALAHITSKISNELGQVWRQISIMHKAIVSSSDTLEQLQNQTTNYVNGSSNALENIKNKAGTITGRINEVDDNLNYLIGKLSLVTQEFNQIRAGLGKAFEEIRGTYKTVKNQMIDQIDGPGPHSITNDNNLPSSV